MSDELDAAIASAFPDGDLQEIRTLESTGDSDVARVDLATDRFIVKCAPTVSAAEALAREVAVTNYVRRTTPVPVVEFRDIVLDPSQAPAPFYVAPWCPGSKLCDVLDSSPAPLHGEVFTHLGETLARLHDATAFDAPGDVDPGDDSTFEVHSREDWASMFDEELAEHVSALADTRFEELATDVRRYVRDRLPSLDTGETPVLVHGDIGDGNVVCDGSTVTAVLDWERAFVGHPEYDLCRAETRYFWNSWGRRGRPQSKLYEGYRATRALPSGFDERRTCYLATFSLGPLASFEDWGPQFSDDLDGLAASLGRRIRRIFK